MIYKGIQSKTLIHFEVLDESTSKPVPNLEIFAETIESESVYARTITGEQVWVYGSGKERSNTKKIGKTDQNGIFKKMFWINHPSFIFIDVLNSKTNVPNCFRSDDLSVTSANHKKTIVLGPEGEMKILNPNKKKKVKQHFRLG